MSLVSVSGIHWWLVDSPHKGPVVQKMFTFDDVLMTNQISGNLYVQPLVQVHIKENITALHHWPLWVKSTDDRWIPLPKGQ